MRRVRTDELLDYVTFTEKRAEIMPGVLAAKVLRRIHVGENLTFLFENATTVRWQVHEMLRAERIVRTANIEHELATYNELLGGPGEFGVTLLVEIEDPLERDAKLRRWLTLPEHLYLRLEDGTLVRARVDERQRILDRLSSVQYLTFDVGGQVPVAIGCDHEDLRADTVLTVEQRTALAEDLAS